MKILPSLWHVYASQNYCFQWCAHLYIFGGILIWALGVDVPGYHPSVMEPCFSSWLTCFRLFQSHCISSAQFPQWPLACIIQWTHCLFWIFCSIRWFWSLSLLWRPSHWLVLLLPLFYLSVISAVPSVFLLFCPLLTHCCLLGLFLVVVPMDIYVLIVPRYRSSIPASLLNFRSQVDVSQVP